MVETCELCGGRGYVSTPEGGYRECDCRLKARALVYLTEHYAGGPWDKNFAYEDWLRDVTFVGKIEDFRAIVKSVLLCSGMEHDHLTVQPYDVLRKYLEPEERNTFYELKRVKILIVLFVGDPANKEYSRLINSVIQTRQLTGRWTWAFSTRQPTVRDWIGLYGEPLSKMLMSDSFAMYRTAQ